MTRNSPTLSVAVTTFQGERHLARQLDSIVTQSRLPDEVVVSDDASTDSTVQILEDFTKACPVPVRLLVHQVNRGLRRNVESALAAVSGSVTVLADQDDTWAPDKLEQIDLAFTDPEVTLWFSDAVLIDQAGVDTGRTLWEEVAFGPDAQSELRAGYGLRRLLQASTVTGATMAVRSNVLPVALPLPEQLEVPGYLFLHDGWLAVLAHLLGRTVVEPRFLTRYRQHDRQFTKNHTFRHSVPAPASPALLSRARGDPRARHGGRLLVDHARVSLVADRLRESGAWSRCRPDAGRELLALEEFLDVRTLPRGTRGRRTRVVRQAALGRYRRFGSGVRTAALDLL